MVCILGTDRVGQGYINLVFPLVLFYLRIHPVVVSNFFFFQAEDGIRDAQESRGLGDVYKRQDYRGI